ncbi:transposase [Paenibacillus alvei]
MFLLQDHGVWVNHKKVLRLMQAMNLRSNIAESVVVTPHP